MTIDEASREIRELYLSDQVPWVVGYSGGKDSTAVLQLIWRAVSELEPEQRTKPIHVISTDTLVENPVVVAWVNRSLTKMREAATDQGLPIQPHRLTPEIANSFWVNLIGRGYPAPRNKFRWCTERLKIMPSNKFIREVVRESGEAILVLGTRKAESSVRAHNMARQMAVRDRLTLNAKLTNCLVYSPIEDWSNDDVWMYLMRVENPWGYTNKDLLSMYRGASEDGECPLVVDDTTPSCGSSRFGCWVCTLVDQDKSMGAMIQNDEEKEWMLPLLELRNELDFRGDVPRSRERQRRDFRRMSGKLTFFTNAVGESQLVHGPYTQKARAEWLQRLLKTQQCVRKLGPLDMKNLELVSLAELEEIRRIWVVDKHEIEDLLPQIYEEATSEPYPGSAIDDNLVFDTGALELLRKCCGDDDMSFELARNLLDIERRYRTMTSRRGLFDALEEAIERCFYENEEDAVGRARARQVLKSSELKKDEHGRWRLTQVATDPIGEDLALPLFQTAG